MMPWSPLLPWPILIALGFGLPLLWWILAHAMADPPDPDFEKSLPLALALEGLIFLALLLK